MALYLTVPGRRRGWSNVNLSGKARYRIVLEADFEEDV